MKLPQHRRTAAALAVSAAFLVPLALFGAPALAGSTNAASSSQYQYKVAVCHKTHAHAASHQWVKISVGAPAVKAHLKHGDFVIDATHPCPPTAPAAPATSSTTHGNSSGHGNSDNGHAKGHNK